MSPTTGPAVLADAAREVWAPLFESSHEPHREDAATIRNYFNIHSGGSEKTIAFQIQTFKAVCDHADFKVPTAVGPKTPANVTIEGTGAFSEHANRIPTIHIDLHIHLPENKSRRDYEYIFEDIARYILGRNVAEDGDERE